MGIDALPSGVAAQVLQELDIPSAVSLAGASRHMRSLAAEDVAHFLASLPSGNRLPDSAKIFLDDSDSLNKVNLNILGLALRSSPGLVGYCTPLMMLAIAGSPDDFQAQCKKSADEGPTELELATALVNFCNSREAVLRILKHFWPDKASFLAVKNSNHYHILHLAAMNREDGLLQDCIRIYDILSDELAGLLTTDNRNLLDCAVMNPSKNCKDLVQYLVGTHNFNADEARSHSPGAPSITPRSLAEQYHSEEYALELFASRENTGFDCGATLFAQFLSASASSYRSQGVGDGEPSVAAAPFA